MTILSPTPKVRVESEGGVARDALELDPDGVQPLLQLGASGA